MRMALELAGGVRERVSPNPRVGAVVVKDGTVRGTGAHESFGGPHAEVNALTEAGADAKGAALYVTLEPCAHHGKTPPCTETVIAAGVTEVFVGAKDPNPAVTGGGMDVLRKAGIAVTYPVLGRECLDGNAAYFKYVTQGAPLVTAKWAMTLDGRIATKTGDSRWVSSRESRRRVHELRARVDDNPLLTCRLDGRTSPRRVVVDSGPRLSCGSKLVASAAESEVIVAVGGNADTDRISALEAAGCTVLQAPGAGERVDIAVLLKKLAERTITSVLVEGGGTLLGECFDNRLVDRAIVFVSRTIIGGKDARSPVEGFGLKKIADAFTLRDTRVSETGGDVVIEGKIGEWPWEPTVE